MRPVTSHSVFCWAIAGLIAAAPLVLAHPAQAQASGGLVEQKEQSVEALRDRAEQLEQALQGDVCENPDSVEALLTPTLEQALDGLPPVDDTTSPDAQAATPAPPPIPAGPEAPPLRRQEMVDRIHEAVVLVIAEDGTGSGFFVLPNIVLTNDHVIEENRGGRVLVVGRGLSRPMEAKIIARTRGSAANDQRDYAILRVPGANVAHPLPMTPTVSELTSVVAAGYPGLLLEADNAFRSLLRGDMTAMPELVFTQGTVMALQNRNEGLPNIAHTAEISGGNSGGPLIDACGRVVGINSFIMVDVEQASNAGFALPSSDLLAFAKRNGVTPQIDNRVCGE